VNRQPPIISAIMVIFVILIEKLNSALLVETSVFITAFVSKSTDGGIFPDDVSSGGFVSY